jgi:hypothetical protein
MTRVHRRSPTTLYAGTYTFTHTYITLHYITLHYITLHTFDYFLPTASVVACIPTPTQMNAPSWSEDHDIGQVKTGTDAILNTLGTGHLNC